MKYIHYSEEDFVKDEYFQKWILKPDSMSENFWKNWMAAHPEKKEALKNAAYLIRLMDFDTEELSDKDFGIMWQNIIERRSEPKKRFPFLKVAAVFIGVMGTALGAYQWGGFNITDNVPTVVDAQIMLELQDGEVKILNETASEIITDINGQQVVSHEGNTLLYNKESTQEAETLVYNKLTVPYGKKFELVLSDGSHVFLNSGSKLRYPVAFLKGEKRDVFLDGEAYFSVEKDETRPFTVITDEMNTQVYGTEFNVSNYKDENNTSVVLVEGSVGVYKSNNSEGQQPVNIIPGQRAVFKDGNIAIDRVNVNKYTAWTEGKLFFVDDDFELILKELERHFNVVIDNQFFLLNEKRFTGTFTDESLTQILRTCQEHTPFEYSVDGNTVIIKQKE